MITAADVADIAGVVLPLVVTPGASFALTVAGAVERSRWIAASTAVSQPKVQTMWVTAKTTPIDLSDCPRLTATPGTTTR